jgi:hypothetical protein
MNDIQELLQKIVLGNTPQLEDSLIAKVLSVSDTTCNVEIVLTEATVENVMLNVAFEGIIVKPKKGSHVIITRLSNVDYYVSQYSKIDDIIINADNDIVINGGKNEGLVKIKELTEKLNALVSDFNAFVDIYSSHTHAVSGASTGAPSVPATATKIFNQSYYENTKIKH